MQFVAERRIENGLLSVTLTILNLLHHLYTKKSCEFFQSYEKSRAKQKNLLFFFALCSLFRTFAAMNRRSTNILLALMAVILALLCVLSIVQIN